MSQEKQQDIEVVTIPLSLEGINTIGIPKDGEFLNVVVHADMPALAFRAERLATLLPRRFVVTRQHFPEGVSLGKYMGMAQPAERAPLHVFEDAEQPKEAKKK